VTKEKYDMKRLLTLPLATAALALAPVAQAHVTVHPNVLPADSFVQVVVRVPSERGDADTTKVELRFPPGFLFASYQPVPGWTAKIVLRKLARPVTVFGEKHTEEVGEVVWSGGRIAPGQFVDFPLSISTPNKPAGTRLTFKALQTYSSGEIVRWIGAPSADTPAPQVVLTAKNAEVRDVPAGPTIIAQPPIAMTPTDEPDDSTKENVALALGIIGTVAGLLALAVVFVRTPRSRDGSR
jgi:periplasmic copper chaperone A